MLIGSFLSVLCMIGSLLSRRKSTGRLMSMFVSCVHTVKLFSIQKLELIQVQPTSPYEVEEMKEGSLREHQPQPPALGPG